MTRNDDINFRVAHAVYGEPPLLPHAVRIGAALISVGDDYIDMRGDEMVSYCRRLSPQPVVIHPSAVWSDGPIYNAVDGVDGWRIPLSCPWPGAQLELDNGERISQEDEKGLYVATTYIAAPYIQWKLMGKPVVDTLRARWVPADYTGHVARRVRLFDDAHRMLRRDVWDRIFQRVVVNWTWMDVSALAVLAEEAEKEK